MGRCGGLQHEEGDMGAVKRVGGKVTTEGVIKELSNQIQSLVNIMITQNERLEKLETIFANPMMAITYKDGAKVKTVRWECQGRKVK